MVLDKTKKDFLSNASSAFLWFVTQRAEIESIILYTEKKETGKEVTKKLCKINWYVPYFL